MKKIILFILIFCGFSFAQYGPDIITNGDFDLSIANWSNSKNNDDTLTFGGRGPVLRMTATSTPMSERQTLATPSLGVGATYFHSFYYYIPSGNTGTLTVQWRWVSATEYVGDPVGDTDAWTFVSFTDAKAQASSIYATVQILGSATVGDIVYVDSWLARQKLDILYINGGTGNDTNLGEITTPIATLDETEIRGFYAGGTFDITAGTYDETWTIGNNTIITATGVVIITAVDFGSYTCTVDCRVYNNIGTIMNDENVIVNNSLRKRRIRNKRRIER